jgi:putative hydrolase of the HAD superfamily
MPGRHDHREPRTPATYPRCAPSGFLGTAGDRDAAPIHGRRPRGLLLDFGGVLTTSLLEGVRRFCVECGLAPDTLLDLFRGDPAAQRLLVDVERGVIGQPEFEAGIGALLGVDHERLVERLLGTVEPEPAILAAADRARAAGIRTAVLSNSWGLHPYDPYAGWGLTERFDALVISQDTGMRKPDPAIYTLAAERLGLPCEACVFVDDLPHNLEPARALGMTVIHKTSAEQLLTDLENLFQIPLR